MANANLLWSNDAKHDIQRLHEFLALKNPHAADGAIGAIIEGSETLSQHPEIGRPFQDTKPYREIIVPYGSKSYIIRYRYYDDTVFIVKIWHGIENRD